MASVIFQIVILSSTLFCLIGFCYQYVHRGNYCLIEHLIIQFILGLLTLSVAGIFCSLLNIKI